MLTRPQLIWVLLFGFAAALPDNSIGLILKLVFPTIPLVGGLVSSTFVGALLYLGIYMAPRFGAGVLYMLSFISVAIVTPSFGPPGPYKLLIALILGLYVDLFVLVGRYSRVAYFMSVMTAVPLSLPATYVVWYYCGVQGKTFSLLKALTGTGNSVLLLLYFATGVAGAYLGQMIYESRIAKLDNVVAIRGRG